LPGDNRANLTHDLKAIMLEAGELARLIASSGLKSWNKGHDHSPVTEGDIAVNNLLRERLTSLEPEAGWLSEENEDHLPANATPLTWIVDPIDGTRAYISGHSDWTISVALVKEGRPIVAALYAPVSKEMFMAVRGSGATLNGTSVCASDARTIIGSRLVGPKHYLERLKMFEPSVLPQAKVHSLALRLTRVAQGTYDLAFASGGSRDWDLAAADLLVHEAGGVLTDFAGQPLTFDRPLRKHGALIAAGPARHATILALLRDRTTEFA
jgi:myo-inositol-1(or 4)-monophosphatase